MDNLFVTKNQLKYFRKKWEEWVLNDLKGCDPTIADILIQLNRIKGLNTVFCCIGHHEGEAVEETEQFYIAMVATDRGFSNLISVFSRFRNELSKCANFDLPFYVDLKSSVLLGKPDLPDTELAAKSELGEAWYPVWVIEGFFTREDKQETIEALRRTLHIKWNHPVHPDEVVK